jgi:hypothetical protein
MTFLKKLGQILAQVGQFAIGIEPLIDRMLPNGGGIVRTVSQDLTEMANVVVNIETLANVMGTPGPDRLKQVAALLGPIVLQSAVVAKHDIGNPALFQQSLTGYAQATVDLLNSLKADNIQVTAKA